MTRAAVRTQPVKARKPRAAKVIIEEQDPETIARQTQAALARVQAAEAARPKTAKEKAAERAARATRAREAGNRAKANAERAASLHAVPVKEGPAAAVKPLRSVPEPEDFEFDLGKAIGQLTPEYIQCRDYGHPWKPFTARWVDRMNHYEVISKCPRCGTERMRYLGSRGNILGAKYEYADGYSMKGSGRLSTGDRDHIRLASLRIIEVREPARA